MRGVRPCHLSQVSPTFDLLQLMYRQSSLVEDAMMTYPCEEAVSVVQRALSLDKHEEDKGGPLSLMEEGWPYPTHNIQQRGCSNMYLETNIDSGYTFNDNIETIKCLKPSPYREHPHSPPPPTPFSFLAWWGWLSWGTSFEGCDAHPSSDSMNRGRWRKQVRGMRDSTRNISTCFRAVFW